MGSSRPQNGGALPPKSAGSAPRRAGLLATFAEYGIHATWATVGFLFFRTRTELLASLPDLRPDYDDLRLSPYPDMKVLGTDEGDDPFHFGRSLIDQIRSYPGQEIATDTFSHYYCLATRC